AKYKYGRRARSGKESHLKGRRFEDEDGSEGQADASDVGSDLRDRLADPQLAEIGIEPKPVARHFYECHTSILTICLCTPVHYRAFRNIFGGFVLAQNVCRF